MSICSNDHFLPKYFILLWMCKNVEVFFFSPLPVLLTSRTFSCSSIIRLQSPVEIHSRVVGFIFCRSPKLQFTDLCTYIYPTSLQAVTSLFYSLCIYPPASNRFWVFLVLNCRSALDHCVKLLTEQKRISGHRWKSLRRNLACLQVVQWNYQTLHQNV